MNRRHSSRLLPTSVGTRAMSPRSSASSAVRGRKSPSTLGCHGRSARADPGLHRDDLLRALDLARARIAHRRGVLGREPERVEEPLRDLRGLLLAGHVVQRSALEDRAVEQPARGGRREQRSHAHAARGLAEDRHVPGVAAERGDVLAHPFERADLVAQAEVRVDAARAQLGVVQEAERAEPVVDRHDDHVAAPREPRAVVEEGRARAHHERAAVDPDHHRAALRVGRGRPDVEREAVLRLAIGRHADQAAHEPHLRHELGRRRAELDRRCARPTTAPAARARGTRARARAAARRGCRGTPRCRGRVRRAAGPRRSPRVCSSLEECARGGATAIAHRRHGFASTPSPAAFHASKPPISARARCHPLRISSRAARALVASFGHVQ